MAPIIPFIPLIAAGIGAAVTGVELAHQPSPPKPDVPPTQQATQTAQAEAQQAAALAQANALQQRRGMASTILNSPMTSTTPTTTSTLGT